MGVLRSLSLGEWEVPVKIGRRKRSDKSELRLQESYQQVWRQRDELGRRVAQLEQELEEYRERESLVRDTLMTAQRAAGELRVETEEKARKITEKAKADAKRILDEATGDAAAILERASVEADELKRVLQGERAELQDEVRRLRATSRDTAERFRSLLVNALQLLDSEFRQEGAVSREPNPSAIGDPTEGQVALSAVRGSRGLGAEQKIDR
jgi:cell division septum initiation protein DivIVA